MQYQRAASLLAGQPFYFVLRQCVFYKEHFITIFVFYKKHLTLEKIIMADG